MNQILDNTKITKKDDYNKEEDDDDELDQWNGYVRGTKDSEASEEIPNMGLGDKEDKPEKMKKACGDL